MADHHSFQIFDGAIATELGRRGWDLSQANASVHALQQCPELICTIHREYLLAGAEVLRCSSFALHQYWIQGQNFDRHEAHLRIDDNERNEAILQLCNRSVQLAMQTSHEYVAQLGPHTTRNVKIVASLAPPHRTYESSSLSLQPRPHLLPSLLLPNFYAPMARALLQAGCDALLIETIMTLDLALEAIDHCHPICHELHRPLWLSVVTGATGDLLGQGSFSELLQILEQRQTVNALFINCIDIQHLRPALVNLERVAQALPHLDLGILPHLSAQCGEHWQSTAYSPHTFARIMSECSQNFLNIRTWGACCGSTPEHIAALREAMDSAHSNVLV